MRPSPSQCYFSPRFHCHCLNAFNVLGGPLKSFPLHPNTYCPSMPCLRYCASAPVFSFGPAKSNRTRYRARQASCRIPNMQLVSKRLTSVSLRAMIKVLRSLGRTWLQQTLNEKTGANTHNTGTNRQTSVLTLAFIASLLFNMIIL